MAKSPIERLMAHHGGVLSIDWKGGVDAASILADTSSDEGKASSSNSRGWLATAGMDGTVKVSLRSGCLVLLICTDRHLLNADLGYVDVVTYATNGSYPAYRASVALCTLVDRSKQAM